MVKKIISVGFQIPGGEVEFVAFKSKRALLDYDIAVFNPTIDPFHGYETDEYQGKPCLSDSASFSLKEHLEHWRRETREAIRAGKTVFVLLNRKEDVFVATGTHEYSGTGRNVRTTRHVESASNYSFLSPELSLINSEGFSMTLNNKNSLLAPYWASLTGYSKYHVLIDGTSATPLIMAGTKTCGALVKYKNASGALILLPFIDTENPDFTEMSPKGRIWGKNGKIFGKKFVAALCDVDKALRESTEKSIQPDWVAQAKFELPTEKNIRIQMLELETTIEKIQQKKEQLRIELDEHAALKALLYEQGKPLELAVLEALKIIGFNAVPFKKDSSEFDVVFESEEGRLLGEVEGKDNKPINVDKLRQLQMNIQEDFERDEITQLAKGALIGNAFRNLPPDERPDFFTEKCLTSAQSNKTALIRTIDLFTITKYLLINKDDSFAKNCRTAIVNTTGLVVFPQVELTTDTTTTTTA